MYIHNLPDQTVGFAFLHIESTNSCAKQGEGHSPDGEQNQLVASNRPHDGALPPCVPPGGVGHFSFSLHRLSKHGSGGGGRDERSRDELELPKELTEDWVTMEICVDCKKFIMEIISSSRSSLSMASKRARLNRKTQSFYMSSSSSVNFLPSERTINEV